MAICLGIDASAGGSSAAVIIDGKLAADRASERDPSKDAFKGSGEILLSLVHSALAAAGVLPSQIDSVAVGIGPGSFTGIRNGISTALGFSAYSGPGGASLPVYGVSSLLAIAIAKPPVQSLQLLLLPANRQENFGLLYRFAASPEDGLEILSGALILPIGSENSFLAEAAAAINWGGGAVCEGNVSAAPAPSLAALSGMAFERRARMLIGGEVGEQLDRILINGSAIGSAAERRLHFQISEGGQGLLPLYAKPVQAKSLVERGIVRAE